MPKKTHLEFRDGRSNKFWEVSVAGDSHTVRYGKIGTAGQTKTKKFSSNAEARVAADKLTDSKRKKGYVESRSAKESGKKSDQARSNKASASKKKAVDKPTSVKKGVTKAKASTATAAPKKKLPKALKALQERYDYVQPELRDDGLWVLRDQGGYGDLKPGQHWRTHYESNGREVRSFFCDGDEIVAGKLISAAGELEFRLRKSVQYGDPWTGRIWVSDAAKAVKGGVAGVDIPSTDVKQVEFKVTSFDQETYAIAIKDATYLDAQGNKLDASGAAAAAPTVTAALVEDRHGHKYWRDGEASDGECAFAYYDLEGEKVYEELYASKKRVWFRVYSKAKGKGAAKFYDWNEAEGSVSFVKGKSRYELALEDETPVLRVRSGGKTKTTLLAGRTKTPNEFKKRFQGLYEPFLERGVQLEDQSFLIGGLEVQKYSDFVKVWTILRDYGGNECVYIAEPGPYQGRVFWNDHESGLFAMECMDEFVEEEGLDGEEPNAILEAIPSFDEERSLDDVLNDIRWNRPDSAIALIDGLSPPIWRKAKRSPAKGKSSVAKSKKKRASTKK